MNGITKISYDLPGNVTAITDATLKTTVMAYDGLGRLVAVTDPIGKTTSYARDEAGNAWQVSNRLGQATQTSFDVLNRPAQAYYLTDNINEYTTYDAYGNVWYMYVPNDPVFGYYYFMFGYDNKNRLTSKYDSRTGKTMTFTYDRADNILTKTDYQGDRTEYTYDSANRRVAMRNPAYLSASYQHDGAGRVISRILSDGAQTQYGYNADGQLVSLKSVTANGTVLNTVSYTRDRMGNITNQTDNSGSTNYTYDALYRLSNADYPGTAYDESFTYDAVGNRQVHTLGGVAHAYEYWPNGNRLKAVHAATLAGAVEKSFTYDDEGRLTMQTGAGAKSATWDQKGRAKTIKWVNYRYDPMNYRIGQKGGVLGNRDYYLEGEHLEAEYSGVNLQAKYFRGLSTDELIARMGFDAAGDWSPAIYHHDALMSVTGISSHEGNKLQTASYSAFGDSIIASFGASNNRLTYTGREKDQDTGLFYYRARYYDPTIGRFISEDPLGFKAGINFYAYVNNNPVNGNDPSGMCGPLTANCIGAIYGGIAGGVGGVITAGLSPDQTIGSTLKSLGLGALAGAATGAVTPWLSYEAGAAAAAIGVARTVGTVAATATVGGASSAVGQFAGNVVTGQPLGTDFSWGAVAGSATGNVLASIPARIVGGMAGTAAGTSIPFGSRSLTIMTPTVQNTANTFRAIAEGSIGGVFEAGGQAIQSQYFQSTPSFSQGAAGGFLIYPNKANTNMMQSVYSK